MKKKAAKQGSEKNPNLKKSANLQQKSTQHNSSPDDVNHTLTKLAYLTTPVQELFKKILSQASTPDDLTKVMEEIKKHFIKSPTEESYFCNINYQVRDFVSLNLADQELTPSDLQQLEHYCINGALPTNEPQSSFLQEFYQAVIACTIPNEKEIKHTKNKNNFIGYIKSRDSRIIQQLPALYIKIDTELRKKAQLYRQKIEQQQKDLKTTATQAIAEIIKAHSEPASLLEDENVGHAGWQCVPKGTYGFETQVSLTLPKKESQSSYVLNLVVDASYSMNTPANNNQSHGDQANQSCWELIKSRGTNAS